MKQKILIVEDEFIVANDLRIMLEKAGYKVCGIAPSVVKALELIASKEPSWVLLDIFLQGDKTGIDLAAQLTDMGIPFIYISANTNQGILEAAKATLPYGFLVKPFREKDLMVMLDIAHYRHEQNLKYKQNTDSSISIQIEHLLQHAGAKSAKLQEICKLLQPLIPFDFLWISRTLPFTTTRDITLIKQPNGNFGLISHDELLKETKASARDFKAWNTAGIATNGRSVFNGYDFRKLRMDNRWLQHLADGYKLESALISKITKGSESFQIVFLSRAGDLFSKVHTGIINQFGKTFELLIDKIIYGPKNDTEEKAVETVQPPQPQQKSSSPLPVKDFHGIVGNSPLLQSAFKKIEIVAPDDTSVLILGESGTGKERIAHTIHKLSPRKNKPFITVNCAALPLTLIESELFGHEKGAFTGANDKRIGKFEQADGGSVFLDEIGELPLEAQVKLLRVLQEKEIERLGGSHTRKINVRIITATNRNLEKEVAEGRFRLDLYYRLNVFPIELPALRYRKEDIPLLAVHFIGKYSKRSSSGIKGITQEALAALQNLNWPGNIRELEHLIERTMLLTDGELITAIATPANSPVTATTADSSPKVKTMEEMERDHILKVLAICKGKIFGEGGAAEMLNMPSTTLNSKIKKLGIKFEFVK